MYQKESARRKTVGLLWLALSQPLFGFLYALGDVLTPFIVAAVFGLCFESLGRVASIEAYPPRAGLYDYYGTGFADIAVVGADYRTYVVEPV